jgi:hypothetical protein
MQTLRRIVAVLIFPAIAYLGAACERADTPTDARPLPVMQTSYGTPDFVVDDAVVQCPDRTHTTISAAVAAAGSGDIIQVCPGLYNESVIIGMPLTLVGPNEGISWSGTRNPEAIVSSAATTFNVTNGQDVTIDGFTINGDFGVYVGGSPIVSTTGTVIQSNIITGVTRALTLDAPGSNASVLANNLISNTRSLHVSGGPYTNMKVNGNRFSGPLATTGIFFSGVLTNSIAGFEFIGNQVEHLANIASNISNGTVSQNTFDVVLPGTLSLQISLHNSTVTENTFEGDDLNACLQLFGSQFGLVPSSHVTVSNNTFNNCGAAVGSANFAIQLSPDIDHIFITENEISSGFEGVNTRDLTLWDVTGLEIHINFNNITDNTSFGVRNGQMGILDAECNWWGAADGPGPVGPGSGDNVSTNVDFTPWLTAPAPGGKCIGGLLPSGGQVTGGGQINADGGRGSFGFSANATRQSGHLDYMNHVTRAHLNCTVNSVLILSATKARLSGPCSSKNAGGAMSFTADVEDNAKSGKGADKFTISYGAVMNEGGTLVSGNINIH